MVPKLRTAVIGFGIGEKHARAYSLHPGCELAMLCDFNPAKAEEARLKFPGVRVVADANEVIGNPDIDLVSIASWDNYHFEQIAGSLRSGKHVFAEKPFVMSLEEARRVRAEMRLNPHLKMSSNLVLRTAPRFIWLKEQIRQGKMGTLYHMDASYNYGRLWKLTEGWRGQIPYYSVTYGGSVHMIDLIQWMTGEQIESVCACGNRISTGGSSFRYNDTVMSLLRFTSGMTGSVTANFACVMPHFHGLSVYGTEASFVNQAGAGKWFSSRDEETGPQNIDVDYPGTDQNRIIHSFVDSILYGSAPLIDIDEVFQSMSVCIAIEEAMKKGGWHPVQYM